VSLRARLLLVLAALTAAGLVVANVATYAALRSFLVDRTDRSLAVSARILGGSFRHPGGFVGPREVESLASLTPGVFIEVRDPAGEVVGSSVLRRDEADPPLPSLPDQLPEAAPGDAALFTVDAREGGTDFRVRVSALPFDRGTLVLAVPLDDVQETLHRLALIAILVSAAVLVALVGLGLWLVRVGLRPLRRIEDTAAAIAAGDLSRRIPQTSPRTEVGRLGTALNTMLGQIEEAFAERAASEQRLRRFVADASHELRTPLAAVQAYAELFERGARERPDDLERAMSGIEREARRMGLLVDDLLLLARLDQGRPLARRRVDLSDVAAEAVDAARALDPGRTLTLEADGAVAVTGDPHRLRQVVDNLLANVRAHTPAAAPASVRVAREQGLAVLEVADEGPGLRPDQAARVFERFYRADPSRSRDGGGAGLGLAIVAAIAEAHGGGAAVDSAPGRGTRFRVELPLERAEEPRPPAAAPEPEVLLPRSS
jgi:two-component system OmpR family sensor kinase